MLAGLMNKKIILILLAMSIINGQSLFEGKAGDVWHITGSALGTLAIQKTFEWEWSKSAALMFSLGLAWECCDEWIGRGIFDPAGGSENDIIYDVIGTLLSYPLRYENFQLNLSANKINLRIRL